MLTLRGSILDKIKLKLYNSYFSIIKNTSNLKYIHLDFYIINIFILKIN